MRLKIFRAATTTEALAGIRRELGPDAVILGIRKQGREVEVTAACEPPPEEPVIVAAPPPARPAAQLARHNIPAGLAARLPGDRMEEAIAREFRFLPLPDGRERPLLLAGPPGAGKTLTAGKLATRAALAGTPPLLVTTDTQRAGAAEQLAAFARILGIALSVAQTPAALAKALARRLPGQPAVIDTAGTDPFDPADAAALVALARAADAEVVAVLPAGLDPDEASELARAYAVLGSRLLIPTRLDQARRLGSVLAAAWSGPLAFAEAGCGPGPADGLVRLTPSLLARRLAGEALLIEDTAA
jgi:flagellar biosynthesis protein FlhF